MYRKKIIYSFMSMIPVESVLKIFSKTFSFVCVCGQELNFLKFLWRVSKSDNLVECIAKSFLILCHIYFIGKQRDFYW